MTAAPKPKKKNTAAKKRAKFEREYGGEEYLAFIQSKPCCACQLYTIPAGLFVEAAHSTTGGMGRKASGKTLVPLCSPHASTTTTFGITYVEGCHRQLHRVGVKTFEKKYGIDLKAIAAKLWQEFRESR